VSPGTAGRALRVLVDDGVLHSLGGRGLSVRRKPSAARRIRERREQKEG
jgi:DNA-binding GntR family transcriptional regulator